MFVRSVNDSWICAYSNSLECDISLGLAENNVRAYRTCVQTYCWQLLLRSEHGVKMFGRARRGAAKLEAATFGRRHVLGGLRSPLLGMFTNCEARNADMKSQRDTPKSLHQD